MPRRVAERALTARIRRFFRREYTLGEKGHSQLRLRNWKYRTRQATTMIAMIAG